MNNNLIPLDIRSHLIPFLFDEMEGKDAYYEGQNTKMIPLLPSSTMANFIYAQIGYVKSCHVQNDKILIYLSIHKKGIFELKGTIYIEEKGIKKLVLLSQKQTRAINNLFEDLFRTSMVFFIDGLKLGGISISKGILIFMKKYSLEEYGFEFDSIRKLYYKQKKKKLLNRFQAKSANSTVGYF